MKHMFMQQETKLHFNCFPLDYCDHNNLKEKYPKSIYYLNTYPTLCNLQAIDSFTSPCRLLFEIGMHQQQYKCSTLSPILCTYLRNPLEANFRLTCHPNWSSGDSSMTCHSNSSQGPPRPAHGNQIHEALQKTEFHCNNNIWRTQ